MYGDINITAVMNVDIIHFWLNTCHLLHGARTWKREIYILMNNMHDLLGWRLRHSSREGNDVIDQ